MKKNLMLQNNEKIQFGQALIMTVILIGIVFSLVIIAVSLSLIGLNRSNQGLRKTQSLHIAEAGINYYLWHLVHAPTDYCDGNTCPPGQGPYGPYVHDYVDNTGKVVGTYTIWVAPPGLAENGKVTICHTPPATDETKAVAPSAVAGHLDHGDYLGPCGGGGTSNNTPIVTVESRGDVADGNENRTIVAQLGIPSFAQYAVVANDTVNHLRFGVGTEVFGPIHNNGGVRFDGVAHELVSSSLATYDDPDHSGPNEPGVHTHQPNPNSVFLGGTAYPVPPVNFAGLSSDFANLKNLAQTAGSYIGPSGSGSQGWHITLKQNDTYDLKRVTSVSNTCSGQATDQILSETTSGGGGNNLPFPGNGVIFVEDKLWIDGRIDSAALTIVAAKIGATGSQEKSIIINSDVEYTNYDGTDSLGLIAQRDISVGLVSEGAFSGSNDNQELRIDAAMIAQNGRIGRNYFARSCNSTYYQRKQITIYGSIATNQRYGFTWICGGSWDLGDSCDSGYQNRTINYDSNLALVPPPYFPKIGTYAIIDWREE